MKFVRCVALSLAFTPVFANADFCDLMAGGGAASCRTNAANMGATVIGNWLRLKPESATQPNTGKKGKYVAATTPTVAILGWKTNSSLRLTTDCFAGTRSMSIQAMPYMLGLANGKQIQSYPLTFKIDDKPAFTEEWPMAWQHKELQAPSNSVVATRLQGAKNMTVTTEGVVGNKSVVGYVFSVDGFDKVKSTLCL